MVVLQRPLVGRDRELAAIDAYLDDPDANALVLEGEPGIGKSTLWLEALARAGQREYRVLRAQPAENETKLSYAALADLVAPAYDEVRDALPEPQRGALDVALLRSPGSASVRTVGSALVSALTALAQERTVVVGIDDAQWLDRASARSFEFAARRLPPGVKLLLARRLDGGSLELAAPQVVRVEVGPLSLGALHHVLQGHLGAAPSRPTLLRIAQTSAGNPFFAIAIARSLPVPADPGGLLPIPPSLQELVADRLNSLSPAAREAALVAAALARPTVESLGGPPEALAEAEDAGVLVVERDRVRFTHPLLASVVYVATGGTRRLELHKRLAGVVVDPEERARHLALCTTKPDEVIAAELESAAAGAARRGAQDAAAELFRAAHRLTPSTEVEARARRRRGEAVALHAAGSPDEAREAAEDAVATAPGGPARAEALFELSTISWVAPGKLGPLDYLRLALDEARDDRRLRGRIQAKLGMYSENDEVRALQHLEAAAGLLDEDADAGLLAYTLLALLFFGTQTGRPVDDGLLKRALDLEQRAGRDSERSSLVLIWYQCLDDFAAARERHRAEDEWYRDRGEEIWVAEKRAHLALVEFRAGNWDLARELVEQSCDELEPVGSQGPLGMPFWTRARFDAHVGRTAEAQAALRPMLDGMRNGAGGAWFETFVLEALGFAALTEGDLAGACRAFAELEQLLESMGVTVPLAVRPDADHVEAAVGLGDLERARELLSRFERRAASAPRAWTRQSLPRAQALVLAAGDDLAGALALAERAPEALPFEHARNLLLRGSLERRLKRKRAAATSLAGAAAVFERLGSPDWARRAHDELGRVGLRKADPFELTGSERRIAELAASGMTNREIAQAAFVSPKTVEANLARVYRKLGIRSRAELGAAMAREGHAQT